MKTSEKLPEELRELEGYRECDIAFVEALMKETEKIRVRAEDNEWSVKVFRVVPGTWGHIAGPMRMYTLMIHADLMPKHLTPTSGGQLKIGYSVNAFGFWWWLGLRQRVRVLWYARDMRMFVHDVFYAPRMPLMVHKTLSTRL